MSDFAIFTQHLPVATMVARITPSDIGAIHEVEPGFLKGVLYILGALFHAEFIRVKYTDASGESEDNEDGDGVQGPWNEDESSLCSTWWNQSMVHVDECVFATVRVPGFEGQYVLLIHPGER